MSRAIAWKRPLQRLFSPKAEEKAERTVRPASVRLRVNEASKFGEPGPVAHDHAVGQSVGVGLATAVGVGVGDAGVATGSHAEQRTSAKPRMRRAGKRCLNDIAGLHV
jgi:hypothetical protein